MSVGFKHATPDRRLWRGDVSQCSASPRSVQLAFMIWSRHQQILPWAQEKKHSWNAKDPATVYYTPETLADGTPTTALTVILRTKAAIGGGAAVVHFVDTSTTLEMM